MNLPNKLTLLRMVMVIPFVVLMMAETPLCDSLAAAVFAAASVTDWIDGYYARKHNQITDFGKLMDPIADKLLVVCALIGLVARGITPWLVAMLIIGREIVISGIRLVAVDKGVVIPASKLAKVKTTLQMIAVLLILLSGVLPAFLRLGHLCMWGAALLAAITCIQYIIGCREVFRS